MSDEHRVITTITLTDVARYVDLGGRPQSRFQTTQVDSEVSVSVTGWVSWTEELPKRGDERRRVKIWIPAHRIRRIETEIIGDEPF